MGGGIALPLGGEGSAGLLDYVRASPGDRAIQVRLEQGRWVEWLRARPVRVHVQAAAETTMSSLPHPLHTRALRCAFVMHEKAFEFAKMSGFICLLTVALL